MMASWNPPRSGNIYRDTSPTSPLTPLSPSTLPQWLRHTRPRSGFLANGRVRLVAIALGCIVLGWMMTAMLEGGREFGEDDPSDYDLAAAGVLTDPSGFGTQGDRPKAQPGIISENDTTQDPWEAALAGNKPSVSGALADLQSAVKDKMKQWNPYFVKPHEPPNGTAKAKVKGTNSTSELLAGELITDGISEEDRLGARVRIGKCTILFNGNGFWERAIRTHERHNKEHGYRLHVLRQHMMDDVWSKPAYILSLILRELAKPESERLEWLFWVDADTIILNPYIPIDVFLPPADFDDMNLMFSNDWNGLNNGVFPVRVNQWSAMLFASIVAFRHYRPDDPLTFRDQSAMDILLREPRYVKNVVQAPQRWFNAYQGEHNETLAPYQIRRGDFLVHFAGVPNRDERMAYWLARAEQQLDDWEVPLKSTSYIQETRDFWSEQRDLRRNKKELLAEVRLKATQMVEQVGQHVDNYGERLSAETIAAINTAKEKLVSTLGNEQLSQDQMKLEEAMTILTSAAAPLQNAISESHQLLLTAAHQAIFTGDKELSENGWAQGNRSPQLEALSAALKQLKDLVMSPQDKWTKPIVLAATNAVTEATARLAEANALAAANANALAAAQKQVQAEAEAAALKAAGGGPPTETQTAAVGASAVGAAPAGDVGGSPPSASTVGPEYLDAIVPGPIMPTASPDVVGSPAGADLLDAIVPGPVVVTASPVVVWTTAVTTVPAAS